MLLSEVVGQSTIKQRLIHAFQEGRFPHASLFLGPEGSGTLAAAIALAQYISCTQRSALDSCGTCNSCVQFNTFQYPDLHFSYPFFNKPNKNETISDDWQTEWREQLSEGLYFNMEAWGKKLSSENKQFQISVYEALNIIRKLQLTPYAGGYKFMIIWMAELIKPETANKLLKLLEEPPERTFLFLLAETTNNMLPTILSRLQLIYFSKITDSEMTTTLEASGVDREKINAVVHYANGNFFLAQQLVSEGAQKTFGDEFQAWMRFCFKRDLPELVKWSDGIHQMTRENQKSFLRYALEQVRQNLLLNYSGNSLVHMDDNEQAFSLRFAKFINNQNTIDLQNEISRALDDISRNCYSKMVLLDLSLKTHHLLNRGVS